MKRLKLLSVVLPVLICLIFACQYLFVVTSPSSNLVASWVFGFLFACYYGRFLYQLAEGKEAIFFSTRIRSDDSDGRKAAMEWAAKPIATTLLLIALLVPWLTPD